jgi:endonuclease YncB( thermonuclease family)
MRRMNHRAFTLVAVVFLTMTAVLVYNANAATIEIDQTGTVATVVDGSSFILSSMQTVRLADISTPQPGQPGYTEAKNYLTGIIQGKTVYLDTDNLAITDQSGRLVCVAYIDYNSSYYLNVNAAMIQNGYAAPASDYPQFNSVIPTSTWFVPKEVPTPSPIESTPTPAETATPTPYQPSPMPTITPNIPEFSALTALAVITAVTVAILLSSKKLRKKGFLSISPDL